MAKDIGIFNVDLDKVTVGSRRRIDTENGAIEGTLNESPTRVEGVKR